MEPRKKKRLHEPILFAVPLVDDVYHWLVVMFFNGFLLVEGREDGPAQLDPGMLQLREKPFAITIEPIVIVHMMLPAWRVHSDASCIRDVQICTMGLFALVESSEHLKPRGPHGHNQIDKASLVTGMAKPAATSKVCKDNKKFLLCFARDSRQCQHEPRHVTSHNTYSIHHKIL